MSLCTPENSAIQKLSILLLLTLSFQQTIIIYPSSHLLFYIIHRFTFLSIYLFHFFFPSGFTCTLTCLPICWSVYHLKMNVLYWQTMKTHLLNQLIGYMSIDAPVHKIYPFIFMHPFQTISMIWPSTQLLLYISTELRNYNCSKHPWIYVFTDSPVNYFPSSLTCTLICQLTYWPTYPWTHPKMNPPFHLDAVSFGLTTKVGRQLVFLRPVNEDGYIRANDCEDSATWLIDVPVHQPTCSFWCFHSK